jgi:hypothetical protein
MTRSNTRAASGNRTPDLRITRTNSGLLTVIDNHWKPVLTRESALILNSCQYPSIVLGWATNGQQKMINSAAAHCQNGGDIKIN